MGTVEDLTELRAYVNRHSVRSAAAPNAVNSTNDRYYEAALDGLTPSPAVSYLLNLTDMTLKDYRSIGAYNAMNIAASIAANRAMEEIENSLTFPSPARSAPACHGPSTSGAASAPSPTPWSPQAPCPHGSSGRWA